ncbi:unnamed protein product [Heterobilharzia americana]|nr:unnamed protein product [Heterobilharzia americana]
MNRSDKYENVRSVYRLLKEKGDIEKLKSHVRQRLILGFASLESTVTKYDDRNTDQTIKLANCIIVDHMKVQECDYSLSVFLPEVGLTDYETEEYVRNFLSSNVRSGCAVWDKMISFRQESNSFLVSILKALSDVSGVLSEKKSTQTFDVDCCELDQKLNDINKEYEAIRSSEILHTKKIFEERLQHYKYEISEQYQLKLTQQMHEFRQNEMNTMKLKMEEEFQKRLDEHVKRLEQEFENRLQSLNEQEKLLKEKYSLSQQKEEREAFIKRQALQAELDADSNRKRENTTSKGLEKYELEIKKHESLLQIREKTLENEIHEHVDRIRMEDEIKLLKQHKEIELQSVQLSENQKILEEKLKTFEQLKQDLIKQQNKFTEMEIFDYNTIKTQNEVFKMKLPVYKSNLHLFF